MNLIELATHTQTTLEQMTARVNSLAEDHNAAIAIVQGKLDAAQAAYAEKLAYQEAMVTKVTAVLQSGDPAQYEALRQ